MADHTLNVRIAKELNSELVKIAKRQNTTVSTLVREQLEDFADIEKGELLKIIIPLNIIPLTLSDIDNVHHHIQYELSESQKGPTPLFEIFKSGDYRGAAYLLTKVAVALLEYQLQNSYESEKDLLSNNEQIEIMFPINPRIINWLSFETAYRAMQELSRYGVSRYIGGGPSNKESSKACSYILIKIGMAFYEISAKLEPQ